MDPLSLTASIATLLGAGGTVANGLDRIRKLKHAPDLLLQLNNEVNDLQLVIRSVDELAQQWTHQLSTSDKQQDSINMTLSRARESVLELERLIAYVLTRETKRGTKVNRLAWIVNLDGIRDVKTRIRAAREDLNAVWAMLSHRYTRFILWLCPN